MHQLQGAPLSSQERRNRLAAGGRSEGADAFARRGTPGRRPLTARLVAGATISPAQEATEVLARVIGALPAVESWASQIEEAIRAGDFDGAVRSRPAVVYQRNGLDANMKRAAMLAEQQSQHAEAVSKYEATAAPLLVRCDLALANVPVLSGDDACAVQTGQPLTPEGEAQRAAWLASHAAGAAPVPVDAPATDATTVATVDDTGAIVTAEPGAANDEIGAAPELSVGTASGESKYDATSDGTAGATLTEEPPWKGQGTAAAVPDQAAMESTFGQDFSNVQVRLGVSELGASDAHAAAAGESIAFASAQPEPSLVAHELAHVAQARNAGASSVAFSRAGSSPEDPAEREADAIAGLVAEGASGLRVDVREAPSAQVHFDKKAEKKADNAQWSPLIVTVRMSDGHVRVWRGATDTVGPLRVVAEKIDGEWDWGGADEFANVRLFKNRNVKKSKSLLQWAGPAAIMIIASIGSVGEELDAPAGEEETSSQDGAASEASTAGRARPRTDDRPGVAGGEGDNDRWKDQPWADIKIEKPRGARDHDGADDGHDHGRKDAHADAENEAGRDDKGKKKGKSAGESKVRGGGHNKDATRESNERAWKKTDAEHDGGSIDGEGLQRDYGQAGGDAQKDRYGVAGASDWWGIFDVPEDIRPLVALGIIVVDANVTGIGEGLVKKAFKSGLKKGGLKKAIREEVKAYSAKKIKEVRAFHEQSEQWARMSEKERRKVLREQQKAIEEWAYAEVQRQVHEQAEKYAQWAAASAKDAAANPTDDVLRQIAKDDAANAARVDQVRQAADELAPANVPDGFYDPQTARRHLEEKYPGEVAGNTIADRGAPNAKLAGKRHPESGIPFDKRGFPIFDDVAAFETRLASDVVGVKNRRTHMKAATADLDRAIKAGQVSKGQFSDEALEAIRRHEPEIPGWTWHHHQERGRMQLVPTDVHEATGHSGGMDTWYGDGT